MHATSIKSFSRTALGAGPYVVINDFYIAIAIATSALARWWLSSVSRSKFTASSISLYDSKVKLDLVVARYLVGQLCINALMMSHISVKEYFLPPPMQYIIHMQAPC